MAYYEGSIKDFNKYFSGFARNKVLNLSAKYKKQIGACEECGYTKDLDSAHITGKGRATIIANILSDFVENEQIKIDLDEFEMRYIAAHEPIEEAIRVLCKPCHRKYDNLDLGIIKDVPPLTVKEEGLIIEELVRSRMNKSKALQIVSSKINGLTHANTIFSNITKTDSWWLQTDNYKFTSTLHIILNDEKAKKLHVIVVPKGSIPNPSLYFKQRNDDYKKMYSDITISVHRTKFIENNGFDLTSYLVEQISY